MFTLNLNSKSYTAKPTGSEVGWIRNNAPQRTIKAEELLDAIARGQTYTCGALTGTTAGTWVSQQIIGVDIDNGDKKAMDAHPLSYYAIFAILKTHGIKPMCIYETFSSTPEWQRYRVLVSLPDPVTDGEKAKSLTRRLCSIFTLYNGSTVVDKSTANDLARMFFGTTPEKIKYKDTISTTAAAIIEQIEDPATVRHAEPEREQIQSAYNRSAQQSREYDHSDELRMLDYVDADDYQTWVCVGGALKSGGYSRADWENWSRKSTKYTPGCCDEKKWRTLPTRYNSMGTLYKMASANGYVYQRQTPCVATAAERAANARAVLDEADKAETAERQQRTGAGMVDAFLETIQTRKYEPMPTGITDIDRAIGGGFIRQQLVLLGAAPGTGKTALAQWIFERMAKDGTSCVYLNLEMSREQVLARSLSRIAAKNGHKIRTTDILQGYKWTDEQRAAVIEAAGEYKDTIAQRMIYNPDGITANLDTILAYIENEAQAAENAQQPAPLIVLDYLQLVTGSPREDGATVIKRAVAELKAYAVKHNTLVFVIIAHNRKSNESGAVSMESGRDTSALEYSADLQLALTYTLCLDRDDQKAKAAEKLIPEEKKQVTLKVTKGRFGGAGTDVDLIFNGETMTYTQICKDFDEQPAPPPTPFDRAFAGNQVKRVRF